MKKLLIITIVLISTFSLTSCANYDYTQKSLAKIEEALLIEPSQELALKVYDIEKDLNQITPNLNLVESNNLSSSEICSNQKDVGKTQSNTYTFDATINENELINTFKNNKDFILVKNNNILVKNIVKENPFVMVNITEDHVFINGISKCITPL